MRHEPEVRSLRRRLVGRLLGARVTVDGVTFCVPYSGPHTPYPGHFDAEPWLGPILNAAHRCSPGVFVDVGANVGQTMLKVKACDPDWSYRGFEPNPIAWNIARDIALANDLKDCLLIPAGLSDTARLLRLQSRGATDTSASLIDGFRDSNAYHYTQEQFVAVFPGAEVLHGIETDAIGVIKIDVEGSELEVTRGLIPVLERDQPMIVCEVLPVYEAASRTGAFRLGRQRELERILLERAYRLFRVEYPAQIRGVAEFGVHGDLAMTNYVFAPSCKLSEFLTVLHQAGDVRAVPDREGGAPNGSPPPHSPPP
jgi:FkbM family methyltransferase